DLGFEIKADLEVAPRPELKGGQMRGAGAQAMADVIASNDEVTPVVPLPAHHDVDVGIVSIPMVNPDPIECGSKILLGLRHQIAGERFQIGELFRVLW